MHVRPGQVLRPIGVLNRFSELRHSKVKYKLVFYMVSSPPSPSSSLKLPNVSLAADTNPSPNYVCVFLGRIGIYACSVLNDSNTYQ